MLTTLFCFSKFILELSSELQLFPYNFLLTSSIDNWLFCLPFSKSCDQVLGKPSNIMGVTNTVLHCTTFLCLENRCSLWTVSAFHLPSRRPFSRKKQDWQFLNTQQIKSLHSLNHSNGFPGEWFLSSKGNVTMFGDISGCHNGKEVLLTSSVLRLRILLRSYHTQNSPTAKNNLASNFSNTKVDVSCTSLKIKSRILTMD